MSETPRNDNDTDNANITKPVSAVLKYLIKTIIFISKASLRLRGGGAPKRKSTAESKERNRDAVARFRSTQTDEEAIDYRARNASTHATTRQNRSPDEISADRASNANAHATTRQNRSLEEVSADRASNATAHAAPAYRARNANAHATTRQNRSPEENFC